MRAIAKTLALVALFGASLTAGRMLVAEVAPWRPETTTAAKLQMLEETGDAIEVVFVGSSRTFRQIDPVVVDSGLSAGGFDVDSLNLGVQGMAGPELLAFAERVLGAAESSLQWLVVDIRYVEPILGDSNVNTTRVTWWHDLPATAQALRDTFHADRPVGRQLDWALNHLVAFGNHATGTGVALDRIRGPGIDPDFDIGPGHNGFVPLDAALEIARTRSDAASQDLAASLEERHDSLVAGGIEEFDRRVARLSRLLADPPAPTALQLDYLNRLNRLAEDHAAGLILLVPPGVSPGPVGQGGAWMVTAAVSDAGPTALNFNDPRMYPELFDFDLWFDENHLGSEGAAMFSRLLAEALAEVMSGR
jgi:hypothetical protein